jgi:hypothetical protein
VEVPRIIKQAISPFAGNFFDDFEFCEALKRTGDRGDCQFERRTCPALIVFLQPLVQCRLALISMLVIKT